MMKIKTWVLPRGRNIILAYHSLMGEQHTTKGYVSPRQRIPVRLFERQLEWLSEFADFVRLDELMRARDDDRWRVAVTFDDGYRDNIELGLPLFRRYQVPITWFVSTRFAENRERLPWWDLLDYVLYEVRGEIGVTLRGKSSVYYLDGAEQRRKFRSDVRSVFLHGRAEKRKTLYASLHATCERRTSLPRNGFADPHLVAQAASTPWVELGGHTRSHINLAEADSDVALREISAGRRTLQEWAGQPIDWFAYPYGGTRSYDKRISQMVRECGFKGAVTTIRGYVGEGADTFELPRFMVPVWAGMAGFRAGVLALDRIDKLVQAAGSSMSWLRSLLMRRKF